MRDLASRDAYGCVLLDILCLLCRPFLQRKGPESAHETLDYQANGPAIDSKLLRDPVYNICFSHI